MAIVVAPLPLAATETAIAWINAVIPDESETLIDTAPWPALVPVAVSAVSLA